MQVIEIDVRELATADDFYSALCAAIGAPEWHGRVPVAFVDSMLCSGINRIEPPFDVRVLGTAEAPAEVRDLIFVLRDMLSTIRAARRLRTGIDTEVGLSIVGDEQ